MVLIRDAVIAGAGAGLIPERIAGPEIAAGRLERWGKVVDRSIEVWVLCPSRQLRSAKANAFIDALLEAYRVDQ